MSKDKNKSKKKPGYSMSVTIDDPPPVVTDTSTGITKVQVKCTLAGGTVLGVNACTDSSGTCMPADPLTEISSTRWEGFVPLNADPFTGNFFVNVTADFQCPGESTHPAIVKTDGPAGPFTATMLKPEGKAPAPKPKKKK